MFLNSFDYEISWDSVVHTMYFLSDWEQHKSGDLDGICKTLWMTY